MGKTLSKTAIEQIETLRGRGVTIKGIAEELGISTTTVQKYMKPTIDIDNSSLALKLLDKGMSSSGIEAITGVKVEEVEKPIRRIIKEDTDTLLEGIYTRYYKNDLSSCVLIAHEVHAKYPKLKYDPAAILALQKKYLTPTGNGEWETYIDCKTNEDIDHLLGGERALF